MLRLDQKVAVVTGGAKGIGSAVAKKLLENGAEVHVFDIDNAPDLADTEKYIYHQVDLTNQSEVERTFSTLNQLDILINNAGVAHVGNVENTTEDDFDRVFSVNAKGAFFCLKEAVKLMKKNGGSIINLASIAATVGLADRFAYSASKGAILTMTYSVAKDYLKDGIRCNAISPGRIHTPFVDGYLEKNYPDNKEEIFKRLSESQPIGRMGQPEEVAYLVLYLCSDEAGFITGSNFLIDGGLTTLSTQ